MISFGKQVSNQHLIGFSFIIYILKKKGKVLFNFFFFHREGEIKYHSTLSLNFNSHVVNILLVETLI